MWRFGRASRLLTNTISLSQYLWPSDVGDKAVHTICCDAVLYLQHLKSEVTGTQGVQWVTDAVIIPLIE